MPQVRLPHIVAMVDVAVEWSKSALLVCCFEEQGGAYHSQFAWENSINLEFWKHGTSLP